MTDESLDNESPDMKRDAEVMKIIEEYAACDADSRDLSERRARLREKAEKNHGISSHALQDGVYKLKRQTKAERLADERATRIIVRAAEGRQAELWPKETTANEKRAENKRKAAAKAAAAAGGETPEQQERRLAGDTNPRNDPANGGAGKKRGRKAKDLPPVVDDQRAAEIQGEQNNPGEHEDEQSDGGAVIDSLMPETKLSQSAIAQQKLVDAKLA